MLQKRRKIILFACGIISQPIKLSEINLKTWMNKKKRTLQQLGLCFVAKGKTIV